MEAQDARTEVQHATRPETPARTDRPAVPAGPSADAETTADAGDAAKGRRALAAILSDLRKPIPERLLETKRISGQDLTYVPWYRAQKILDHYTRGFWEYQIVERWQQSGDFMLTVEVTIHAAEGTFRRQGTGREEPDVNGYGDVQSNAESMAFRRAAAKWGLGLDLYEGGA